MSFPGETLKTPRRPRRCPGGKVQVKVPLMSRLKKYGLNIALVCFGLVAGLLVAEGALKVLRHYKRGSEFENLEELRKAMVRKPEQSSTPRRRATLGDMVMPSPDEQIIYELKPGLDLKFMRAQVRTNSFGMRGPEIEIEKPENTFRIALLGDSFAFGWGVEEEQSFGRVLERNLNTLFGGGVHFQVLNFGVPGYSTFQEVQAFIQKGSCFNPDAVLVYFVQNDFGLPFFVRDVRNEKSQGLFSALEFAKLTWKASNPDAQEQLAQLQGWDPNTSLKRLREYLEERGVPLFVAINPRKSQKMDISRLGSVRKRRGATIIDLRDGLLRAMEARGLEAKELTLSFDPHPSALRHKIYGDLLTSHFWAAADRS